MFDGSLMDYVGRRIIRKTDSKRGIISGLMHASNVANVSAESDDMVFELTLEDGETITLAARSTTWENSDYKFM